MGVLKKIKASNKPIQDTKIKEAVKKHQEQYESLHKMVEDCERYFNEPNNET